MKEFLKSTEVNLINGGYISNAASKPVSNEAFERAQRHAEYIITFAQLAKTKNFKDIKADSLDELRNQVKSVLATKDKTYITAPKAVDNKLTTKLAKEAMDFMNHQSELSKTGKINKFLQAFNVISEFEEFGLFFEQGIAKLNRIYTMDEIVKAVTSTIDLLEV